MKKLTGASFKTTAAPLALGIAFLASPAFAQDNTAAGQSDASVEAGTTDAPTGDAIVVTGSRISRPDLAAASPVTVVSEEQLKLANKPGVEEFLRQIPQAVAGIGQNTNNGNAGVATVNLRGLGTVRTLVLVDGKRFVPYDTLGIVDLNMIPQALVRQVQVVTGGASAVYGSDAIAGVVNFILDSDFTGLQVDAQTGISEKGDGTEYGASLTGGLALGDRGNIILSGSYLQVNKVQNGDRDFAIDALAGADYSSGGSSTNAFGSIDTPGGRFTFTPAGFLPYNANRDAFNFNPQNLLKVPQEKWTATGLLDYDLTDNVEFFARGTYSKTEVQTEIGSSGTFGFSFDINLSNPFLDPVANPAAAGARTILAQYDTGPSLACPTCVAGDGVVRVGVRRRLTELGPRVSNYKGEAWQAVAGLRGDFSDTLKWEVFGQYGKVMRDIAFLNDVDADKTQQALLVDGTFANPVCRNASNGCVPLNLFGAGGVTPAAAQFISFGLAQEDENTQFVTGAFLSGDLPFSLVEGTPAAFAVGVEYRRETGDANPDQALREGNSIGFGSSSPIQANYNVKEAYAEVKIPLIQDQPFFETLGLEAGARYSDYNSNVTVDNTGTGGTIDNFSTGYSNWSYKIGLEWAPVSELRFRAMYQRAVRAPNLQELGLPVTPGTGDALFDPCALGTANPGDATLRQLCLTVGGGVPEDRLDLNDPDALLAQPTAGQVNNFSGGNPTLVPEVAKTLTVGAVFRPTSFLPGFTASVDYFDIKVERAILATPEQAIIDACYYAERVATGTFCSLIKRNLDDGSIEGDSEYGVDATRRNIGLLSSRGIDVNANYVANLGTDARLLLGLALTHNLASKVQFADVLNVYECAGAIGKTCRDPVARWVWNQTTGLEIGQFLAQLTWRHMSSITNDTVTGRVGYVTQPPSAFVVPTIPSYDWFDLAFRYKVDDNFNFRFGVSNLFDKQPPVVGSDYPNTTQSGGNTIPGTYDPIGRFFNAGVTFKF